jgi:FlaG/FlaF family flagellin (archaellin)
MQGARIRRITVWLAAAIATFVVGVSAAMAYPADPSGDGSSPSTWQAYWQQHQKEQKAQKAKHASSKKHRAKR